VFPFTPVAFKVIRIMSVTSVKDPWCLYRTPDPDVFPSQIPDPTTATKEEEKNLVDLRYLPFLNHKYQYHKIVNYFISEQVKEKIWANSLQIIVLLSYPKNCHKALKNMGLIQDPRSGKKLFSIPDPGVKKDSDPGSGSTTMYRYCTVLYKRRCILFYNAN
jgi:hypothetical protein